MNEWIRMKLSECCSSIADGDHQPPPKAETGLPFVTISNMTSTNQFDFSDTLFVPQDYYDKLEEKRKARKDDILYSVVGSFGIPVFMKEDKAFVFQRHIAILRPDNEKIVPRFLFYTMLTKDFYAKADAAAIGAAQRTVSLTALRNMEICIPDKIQQSKIVDTLAAYDDLIENNQKQIKLLEEAAQRLYKEWFLDFRFPGHEKTEIVDGVPEGWHKDAVDSKISLLSGYAFKSSEFVDKGQYKIVTIKNVKDGDFDGNNVSLIDEIPSKMPQHCVLEEGDILLSLTGNVGRVCLVYGDNYLLNQRVAKLKSDIPGFAYCLFRSKDMFDEMNNLANGAAQQNLSPIRTGKVEVCFPSEGIIQRFETTVKPMIDQEIELNKMNVVLAEARDRLLPKLMSGEIEL
jgi:type I restriction enzyme S subunit